MLRKKKLIIVEIYIKTAIQNYEINKIIYRPSNLNYIPK